MRPGIRPHSGAYCLGTHPLRTLRSLSFWVSHMRPSWKRVSETIALAMPMPCETAAGWGAERALAGGDAGATARGVTSGPRSGGAFGRVRWEGGGGGGADTSHSYSQVGYIRSGL